jgi:tetratricopeptide (TPR) repeat protein
LKTKAQYIFLLIICVTAFNFLKAQDQIIDSLKNVLNKTATDTSKIKILSELSEICDIKDIPRYSRQAVMIAEKKIHLPNLEKKEKHFYLFHLSKAYNNIGFYYSEKNDLEKATEHYLNALKIQEDINDSIGAAASLNNIGLIYNQQNKTDKAIEYFEKSLNISQRLNDMDGLAGALINIGAIYNRQGNILKAIDYYNKALKTYGTANNKQGLATALNNIAFIYSNQNDDTKALEYYKKAFALQRELKDKNGIGNSLNNIALILKNKKDYKTALKYFNKCLKIREELDDKKGISLALNNIGTVYIDQKLYDDAIEYCTRSLNVCKEINYKRGMAIAYNSLGIANNKKGDLAIAEVCGSKSLELSKELQFPEYIKQASKLLYDIFNHQKKYSKTLEMLELYIQMRDSLINQETRKASIKSQLKYEYETKATADSVKVAEEKKLTIVKLNHQQNQRYFLYIGIGLTLFFSAFMFNRFRITKKQKQVIEEQKSIVEIQKHLVEEKQQEVLASIRYAKRIQESLLPSEKYLSKNLNAKRS